MCCWVVEEGVSGAAGVGAVHSCCNDSMKAAVVATCHVMSQRNHGHVTIWSSACHSYISCSSQPRHGLATAVTATSSEAGWPDLAGSAVHRHVVLQLRWRQQLLLLLLLLLFHRLLAPTTDSHSITQGSFTNRKRVA